VVKFFTATDTSLKQGVDELDAKAATGSGLQFL